MTDLPVQSNEELQARNDELRAKLEQSNADLQAKLDASAAAVGDTGLTDEDVRRAEHPEEFAHENARGFTGPGDFTPEGTTAGTAAPEHVQ